MRIGETTVLHRVTVAAALIGALALGLAASAPAAAQEEALEPEHHHWHFAGPFGTFDRGALQRGYQVYREICSSCHAMKFMAFRHLGQDGGPFFEDEYPNPNDNPSVKALAAQFIVMDGPDDTGSMFERAGRPSDLFPAPFPNEQLARLANGGALPPDLSLIIKARHHGSDYVRSLLTGYAEPEEGVILPPGMHYNPWFSGHQIRMAPPLAQGALDAREFTYADGTEATTEQLAEDVVEFLTWAADPHAEQRKRTGFVVIAYLSILTILLWFAYKRTWKGLKH